MSSHKNIIFTVLALIVLLGLLHLVGALRPVAHSIATITEPGYSVFYRASVSTKEWFGRLFSGDDTESENEQLRTRIDTLSRRLHELEPLVTENEHLKQALEYISEDHHTATLARIIGQSGVGSNRVVLIDKGEGEGVRVGSLITNESGALLGDVISTTHTTARVRLLTHSDFGVAVKQQDAVAALGIVHGDFSLALKLELIPLDAAVDVGTVITTARIQDTPENIVIGEIESISHEPDDLFQTAIIRPYAELDTTLFVYVMSL